MEPPIRDRPNEPPAPPASSPPNLPIRNVPEGGDTAGASLGGGARGPVPRSPGMPESGSPAIGHGVPLGSIKSTPNQDVGHGPTPPRPPGSALAGTGDASPLRPLMPRAPIPSSGEKKTLGSFSSPLGSAGFEGRPRLPGAGVNGQKTSATLVPLPPKPPETQKIPRPTLPGSSSFPPSSLMTPDGSVDRNIRPRRLAILLLILLGLAGGIILIVWMVFLRALPPKETLEPSLPSSLASSVPSPDVFESAPFADRDTDGDGLSDAKETELGTDVTRADTDGDGYTDSQELAAGYDPLGPGKRDTDRDGLADPSEQCWGTDLQNPDTDGDGYLDGQEVTNNHDPRVPSPNDKLSGPPPCP